MTVLELSRWQFGVTTIYHFLMVPLTIGLSFMVAWFNTRWYRHREEGDLRLTKFFGRLFMINFALGVATGIVQEFQFGMNWAEYSRFVGDVFGAPLAMEGLLAFFMESTFIGLWYFGWDRLDPRIHLATIWLTVLGTWTSAYFIIAANSFMQHPVGVTYNAERGRAELTDIWAVLFNPTTVWAYPHVIAASVVTGAVFVGGVSAWYLARGKDQSPDCREAFFRALNTAAVVTLVASMVLLLAGDRQAKMMFKQQPMKMASAEALCDTEKGAGFSLFAVKDETRACGERSFEIPGLLAFLATGSFDGTVTGITQAQEQLVDEFGDHNYRPNLQVSYWSFRGMIAFGIIGMLFSLWLLWRMRRHKPELNRWTRYLAIAVIISPFIANTFGWVLTEMGRQPWVVAPNLNGDFEVRLFTEDAVSQSVSVASAWMTLIGFALLYGVLAVIEVWLLCRFVRRGLDDETLDTMGAKTTTGNVAAPSY